MPYRERVLDHVIPTYLEALGALVIEGARATGKTSTARGHAASWVRLDQSPALVELAATSPKTLLAGATPRLIDEWQLAPQLWNSTRHEVDDRQAKGQFILSVSATPSDDATRHTGMGRFGRLRLRPMSLAESGASNAEVSLARLAQGEERVSARAALSYEELAAEAVRGGWPGLLGMTDRSAALFNATYLDELVRTELPNASGVRHEPVRVQRLIASLARNLATEASMTALAADVNADDGSTSPTTVRTYLDALQRVFIFEPQLAWSTHLRSRSRLRTAPKVHLVDPSLACAALRVDAARLALDPEYFGFVFESMAVRDLRVYASLDRGEVYHYRDNTGLEIDAIVEYPGRRWGAVEVKLGESRVHEAEANLLKLARERVDTARVGAPEFLMVVTGAEYARTLPSGVHVVPLAALGA